MPRILHSKSDSVTRGVLDKDVRVEHDLIEVTYVDDTGTPHTIFAHSKGPFKEPEDAVAAHLDGRLHLGAKAEEAPAEPAQPAGPVFQ